MNAQMFGILLCLMSALQWRSVTSTNVQWRQSTEERIHLRECSSSMEIVSANIHLRNRTPLIITRINHENFNGWLQYESNPNALSPNLAFALVRKDGKRFFIASDHNGMLSLIEGTIPTMPSPTDPRIFQYQSPNTESPQVSSVLLYHVASNSYVAKVRGRRLKLVKNRNNALRWC